MQPVDSTGAVDNSEKPSHARFAFQLKMFEAGASQIQAQITHLDELLFKIKASFITVWAAMIGWAVTIRSERLLPLAFIVVVAFWMFEGLFRGVQLRLIHWSRQITSFVNDTETLDRTFATGVLPPNLVFPLGVKTTEWNDLRFYGRGLIAPTVATLYLFVGFVTYLLWIAGPFEP